MGDVMVLHAALGGQSQVAADDALLQRLPYARRLELERRPAADRAASLAGLRLLSEGVLCLRGVTLDVAQLRFPDGGKPSLAGGPSFSIAHSGTRVAVALSDACDIGLDLEDVGAHGMELPVLERWVATEAALKAFGAGLRQARDLRLSPDLATAELGGEFVYLQPLSLAAGCVARLAAPEAALRVSLRQGE